MPNDVMLLDRGFRDIVKELEKTFRLKCKMPTCSKTQLTSFQANHTRFLTKFRWVIEAVNGVFKMYFKALEKNRNSMLSHIMLDFRIASALINCFFTKFICDKQDSKQIVALMKNKLSLKNNLEGFIINKTKKNKSAFLAIESIDIVGFPKFDVNQIRIMITHGTYQIKQCFA